MTHRGSARRLLLAVGLAAFAPFTARGQAVLIGIAPPPTGPAPVTGVQTVIDVAGAAQSGATLTTATFGWTGGPCPAAVKVKFFRTVPVPVLGDRISVVAERGPFDVSRPPIDTRPFPLAYNRRTVSLFPPVTVQAGDQIGLTVLTTSCGVPYLTASILPAPAPGSGALWFAGEVQSGVFGSEAVRSTAPVLVSASDSSPALTLLKDRFTVFVAALDPRTNLRSDGTAVKLSDGSGYFSLPDFTGDPSVPEITIKMVDATGSPALGATFWFFYAPLTDTLFQITVRDEKTGTFREYSNRAGGTGAFCGEADTSAFPP
jgi:hypothetical protein